MGSTARMKVQKFCFNERVGWFRFSADFSSYECERKRVHVRGPVYCSLPGTCLHVLIYASAIILGMVASVSSPCLKA